MNSGLDGLISDDLGQDLIEYTLLLAFVALACVALFMGGGKSVAGVWDEGSEALSSANQASS